MPTRLIELAERLAGARVALVGDLMLDRYIFGRTQRISPEAPVPVLHFAREEKRLGGAGFVAAAMAALGADVRLVGAIGDDEDGAEVRRLVSGHGVNAAEFVLTSDRPTVTKMRLLGSSQDRSPQQMIRLDREDPRAVASDVAEACIAAAERAMESADVLCLEDYDKGLLTPEVCRRLIRIARDRGIPVIIDPANLSDYSKYSGATALKLNRPEAERSTGLTVRTLDECAQAAERLLGPLDLEAVVLTLNDAGAYLATRDGVRRLMGTRSRQVADATGAGDTVLAALTVARVAGASWEDAVALANIAGGLEVERLGCVPVSGQEIVRDLLAEHTELAGKERTLETLLPELAHHRSLGRRIVFTNGCFDLIHLGHVKYFQFARSRGDLLVVGVNTDASIRRLKGDRRPIISELDRCSVLEELESINYLVRFDQDTPLELIAAIRPDVLVKGADYTKENVVGWDLVESYGGEVALAPLVDGKSTSSLIQRILDAYR